MNSFDTIELLLVTVASEDRVRVSTQRASDALQTARESLAHKWMNGRMNATNIRKLRMIKATEKKSRLKTQRKHNECYFQSIEGQTGAVPELYTTHS